MNASYPTLSEAQTAAYEAEVIEDASYAVVETAEGWTIEFEG
jgi:hypothetical protein